MRRDDDPFKELEDIIDDLFDMMENPDSGFPPEEESNSPKNNNSNADNRIDVDIHSDVREYDDSVTLFVNLPHFSQDQLTPRCYGDKTVIMIDGIGEYTIDMPVNVVPESAKAQFNNGILTVVYEKETESNEDSLDIDLD